MSFATPLQLPFEHDFAEVSVNPELTSALSLMSGNANRPLSKAIADVLNSQIRPCDVRRFSDGEIFVEVCENVRGKDVFVNQSTSQPSNDNLMELLIMIDALRRASARRITAVIPYFGYARQDRKTAGRTPITAKLVANLIERAGANRVLTVDLHAGQIQGFFDIPTDNLFAATIFAKDIARQVGVEKTVLVSPDVGGVSRTRAIAKRLATPLAIVDKRRDHPGSSKVMNIIGEVAGSHCVMVDDIIGSGGTICNAAEALLAAGARSVRAYCTHAVLSGRATDLVAESRLEELVVTDSIQPTAAVEAQSKIRILSIAPLIASAVFRIHRETSVSHLFD